MDASAMLLVLAYMYAHTSGGPNTHANHITLFCLLIVFLHSLSFISTTARVFRAAVVVWRIPVVASPATEVATWCLVIYLHSISLATQRSCCCKKMPPGASFNHKRVTTFYPGVDLCL